MKRTHQNTYTPAKRFIQLIGGCIIVQIALTAPSMVLADNTTKNDGVIDQPIAASARGDNKELQKQVKKEQRELAKQNRQQLEKKAKKGERLAQVALGNDFASEAQLLTFAPVAANDALSDALRWYSTAAKRGYPGAPSLDASGVSFYAVRVVRNK